LTWAYTFSFPATEEGAALDDVAEGADVVVRLMIVVSSTVSLLASVGDAGNCAEDEVDAAMVEASDIEAELVVTAPLKTVVTMSGIAKMLVGVASPKMGR